MSTVHVSAEGKEVVPVEQDVHAQFFEVRRRPPNPSVGGVLGLDLNAHTGGTGRCRHALSGPSPQIFWLVVPEP